MAKGRGLAIRINFKSDNWCPICNRLFDSTQGMYSLVQNGHHMGYVHEECKEVFEKVFERLYELNYKYKG